MEIVQIISEWKKIPKKRGLFRMGNQVKMVEAIVTEGGRTFTKHLIVAK